MKVAYMMMRVGQAETGNPGSPLAFEIESLDLCICRAKSFLDFSFRHELAGARIAGLAAAMNECVSFREKCLLYLDGEPSRSIDPAFKGDRATLVKRALRACPYFSLLRALRSCDHHRYSLPIADGLYWIGDATITGFAVLQITHSGPGMSLRDGVQLRKWHRNANISTRSPIVLAIQDGNVTAYDESVSRYVNVREAVSLFVPWGMQLVKDLVGTEG